VQIVTEGAMQKIAVITRWFLLPSEEPRKRATFGAGEWGMSETNNKCVLCGAEFHATYSQTDRDWRHWKEVAEKANVCTECQMRGAAEREEG